jgi:hypothetical protein
MDTLQKFHKKAFYIITISGFAVIALFLWLQFTGRTDTPINQWASLISGFIFLISAVICFIYYKKGGDRGGVSNAILWTGISSLLFFLGGATWNYYNLFAGIESPYPSLADMFFILMPISFAISVGSLLQIYKSSTKASSVAVATVVFLALVWLMFHFVGKPEISSELSFWENFFNFSYALSDSLYTGAGFALLIIAGGKIYKGIFVWVLAMFIITIADIVFSARAATESLWNGDISDQLYTLSAIFFTYAVILLSKIPEQKKFEI